MFLGETWQPLFYAMPVAGSNVSAVMNPFSRTKSPDTVVPEHPGRNALTSPWNFDVDGPPSSTQSLQAVKSHSCAMTMIAWQIGVVGECTAGIGK